MHKTSLFDATLTEKKTRAGYIFSGRISPKDPVYGEWVACWSVYLDKNNEVSLTGRIEGGSQHYGGPDLSEIDARGFELSKDRDAYCPIIALVSGGMRQVSRTMLPEANRAIQKIWGRQIEKLYPLCNKKAWGLSKKLGRSITFYNALNSNETLLRFIEQAPNLGHLFSEDGNGGCLSYNYFSDKNLLSARDVINHWLEGERLRLDMRGLEAKWGATHRFLVHQAQPYHGRWLLGDQPDFDVKKVLWYLLTEEHPFTVTQLKSLRGVSQWRAFYNLASSGTKYPNTMRIFMRAPGEFLRVSKERWRGVEMSSQNQLKFRKASSGLLAWLHDGERMADLSRTESAERLFDAISDGHEEQLRERQRTWAQLTPKIVFNHEPPLKEVTEEKFSAVWLSDSHKLIEESREMQHCVSAYSRLCAEGKSWIYHIRRKASNSKEEHATAEVNPNEGLIQLVTRRNHRVTNEMDSWVRNCLVPKLLNTKGALET